MVMLVNVIEDVEHVPGNSELVLSELLILVTFGVKGIPLVLLENIENDPHLVQLLPVDLYQAVQVQIHSMVLSLGGDVGFEVVKRQSVSHNNVQV